MNCSKRGDQKSVPAAPPFRVGKLTALGPDCEQIFFVIPNAAGTMTAMSAAYNELLDATISHLERLKARGVRHVPVEAETLRALALPPKATTPALSPAAPSFAPPPPARPGRTRSSTGSRNEKAGHRASLKTRRTFIDHSHRNCSDHSGPCASGKSRRFRRLARTGHGLCEM